MNAPAFHRPLRRCTAGLSLAGTILAGGTAVLALTRLGPGQALVFTTVAVCTAVFAVAVLRAARWALWLATWLLAGQFGAVAGIIWELSSGVDGRKAGQLRRLGFDPTVGVLVNLAYSATGSLLFVWLAVRWWRLRQTAKPAAG
jgi:hypothetical protein